MTKIELDERLFPQCEHDLKQLKKFHRCRDDIDAFARILDALPEKHRGDRMQGFDDLHIYKARIQSQDIGRGKSGGFRAILILDDDMYRFVMIYTHNSEPKETAIRKLVRERLQASGYL